MAAGIPPGTAKAGTGDITGVTAGVGISGGGDSGALSIALDLSELSAVVPTSGDWFSTLDSDDANEQLTTTDALATLLAGDGLAATSAVLAVDLGTNPGLEIDSNKLQIAKGISQHDVAQFGAGVVDNDFLRVDGTSVEGRSASEVLSDISAAPAAGDGNILTVGALDTGSITSGFTSIDVGAGGITTTGAIAGGTIDASTDFTIGTLVITDDSVVMTPSTSDTVTIAAATNGVLNVTTVDNAAAAANINFVIDGAVDIDAAGAINLDSGSGILTIEDSGTEVLRFTESGSGDVTIKLAVDGKDLIFTDNNDDTGMTIKDGAAGIVVPGEVMTTNISFTDGDDAITIADSGLTTIAKTMTFAAVADVVLGDGGNVNISVPLLATTDHTSSGMTAEMLAGAAIAAFNVVCIHTTTQEVIVADASGYATARAIGMNPSNSAISDTATGTILLQGFVRDDTWTWTTGATLYLSETAGAMTETAPTTSGAFVVAVGVALSPDVVYFNPSPAVIEVA